MKKGDYFIIDVDKILKEINQTYKGDHTYINHYYEKLRGKLIKVWHTEDYGNKILYKPSKDTYTIIDSKFTIRIRK